MSLSQAAWRAYLPQHSDEYPIDEAGNEDGATAQFGTLGSALVVEKTVRSGTMSEGLAPGGDKKWTPAPHRSEGVEGSHGM
ncbi:uncharacterized protein RSE6_05170 [Rhynchosporium secalis]|uniref:Uncharacterized protein n=1 Tax=Rhynchosporium secalis TaxID=38038 RepID=A0A1E1M760_RHYSE|nr:uncharacterized protein RSE6_05170 [Rhynchosporium secalis]